MKTISKVKINIKMGTMSKPPKNKYYNKGIKTNVKDFKTT